MSFFEFFPSLWTFVLDSRDVIIFQGYQHLWMVMQCLFLGTVIAVVLASLAYRNATLRGLATSSTSIGLTLPSYALIGLMVGILGPGITTAVVALVFYAALPIVRSAIVGLAGVDKATLDAARGMGMGRIAILTRVELPLAWPVVLSGIRVSGQMTMGIAAIAAYVNGPGLGGLIFTGQARLGGANALESAVAATVAIILLAVLLDVALRGLGRLTISGGIRV